jgi:hypothetical protein
MSSSVKVTPLSFVIGMLLGCNDGGGSDCQAGTAFCPCLNGVICQVGLVCQNNFCIDASVGSTDGPGDGDAGDGDGDGGDGDGDAGDGDGDAGDGDGDAGDGDGDGGDGDGDAGDGDGDPVADDDNDGVANGDDNCPNDANPNQLDFDDNGQGNVCDVLEFNNVEGTLTMQLVLYSFDSCAPVLPFEVVSGSVSMQLDDEANSVGIVISDVVFAPFEYVCGNFFMMNYSFSDLVFTYEGGIPFPISVAHSMAAHNAGNISGVSSNPQMMTATSPLEVTSTEFLLEPPNHDYSSNGNWPTFTLNVMNGGAFGTINWNAPNIDVTPIEVINFTEPEISADINFEDLTGTLELMP